MEHKITQLHNTDPVTFKKQIVEAIIKRIDALEDRLPEPKQKKSKWITRKEASELLGVSLVTISDWTKRDILKGYRIGTRVRFKLDEIEEVLNNSRDEGTL